MADPKKDGPALLLGIGKSMSKDEPDGDEVANSYDGEDEGTGDPLDMHADAMFDALKSGDKEGFKDALKKCLVSGDMGEYSGEE